MFKQAIKNKLKNNHTKKSNNTVTPTNLANNLAENLKSMHSIFEACSDIIIREFKIGRNTQLNAFIIILDGIIDKKVIDANILKSLMKDDKIGTNSLNNPNDILVYIKDNVLSLPDISESKTLKKTVEAVLSGDAVLFIDNLDTAIIISNKAFKGREICEPVTEGVVRGPREGFVETISINISLLRRKIKNPNLKFELMKVGEQTGTDICIAYLKGIANEKLIQEVKQRVQMIEIDSVLESGYIESFIEDAPFSMFPTVGNTEKPDIVCAKILEGRIAILVDGTPFVLTVPFLFVESFQNSEDYYSRPIFATFIRIIRWLGFFITVFTPAFYVAFTNYHAELIPRPLLISIAAATEGTPFPSVIEALLMQLVYEILREGGIRMPRPIGQAVSIVGALVIGEAAVSAGIISSPMVMVIAITAVSSFVNPTLSDSNTIIRIMFIILAGFEGILGISFGIAGVLIYLCSLRSLGIPYTSPIAPTVTGDLKDTFVRVPWWAMNKRPLTLRTSNIDRQNSNQMPKPPEKE